MLSVARGGSSIEAANAQCDRQQRHMSKIHRILRSWCRSPLTYSRQGAGIYIFAPAPPSYRHVTAGTRLGNIPLNCDCLGAIDFEIASDGICRLSSNLLGTRALYLRSGELNKSPLSGNQAPLGPQQQQKSVSDFEYRGSKVTKDVQWALNIMDPR